MNVWSKLTIDDFVYDLIPRESDLVKSFVFGQGRIQTPSLACIFDENEDPQNEDTLLKQVQKRLALPLWTKIMFMRHTTKTRILTEILNSEFYTTLIYNGIFQQQSPMESSMGLLQS